MIWYLWWGIYTGITIWIHSENALAAAEALSLVISFHGTSLKGSQRLSQSTKKIDISYAMKWASCFEFERKSMGTETTTWSEFPSGGKVVVEQILASRNK